MDVMLIKLACLAILAAVFAATVWLTPWFFNVDRSARTVEEGEGRAERALPRSSG
jgi:hypothetical protein